MSRRKTDRGEIGRDTRPKPSSMSPILLVYILVIDQQGFVYKHQ
jgi:hypothetical protein